MTTNLDFRIPNFRAKSSDAFISGVFTVTNIKFYDLNQRTGEYKIVDSIMIKIIDGDFQHLIPLTLVFLRSTII
jgi:hypothetical protein